MKDKETKRKEARERDSANAQLSTAEKIAKLDRLFGKGVGAKKERARLARKVSK